MIDVVYKLGNGSRFDDAELRYSLRSLSNFRDLGKIYVVGKKPAWIKNVIHIPAGDPYKSNKDANIINKIILAATHSDITAEFLQMSDDQLIMNEIDAQFFTKPRHNNIQMMRAMEPDRKLTRWQKRLLATRAELLSRGLTCDCYETHMPCLISAKKFTEIVFQYDYGSGVGYVGNTLYYNTLGVAGENISAADLYRLRSPSNTQKIIREANQSAFFNYRDNAVDGDLFRALEYLFPERSGFES